MAVQLHDDLLVMIHLITLMKINLICLDKIEITINCNALNYNVKHLQLSSLLIVSYNLLDYNYAHQMVMYVNKSTEYKNFSAYFLSDGHDRKSKLRIL